MNKEAIIRGFFNHMIKEAVMRGFVKSAKQIDPTFDIYTPNTFKDMVVDDIYNKRYKEIPEKFRVNPWTGSPYILLGAGLGTGLGFLEPAYSALGHKTPILGAVAGSLLGWHGFGRKKFVDKQKQLIRQWLGF